jgi:ankyrin repeat protein/nucleoside-triphosphatase THEP1
VSTLNMTDTSGYESGLERQAEGTLGWLRNKREYASWMDSDVSRLLWVTGPAGCGKTTMALYVMRTLEKYRHPGDVVCRFFCDENEPSHDVSALLRALIFQIVTRRRKLLRVVRKASDRGGMQILRQFDALWDIFVQIACDSRVASISVIIDGIEGYDRKTQTRLIGRISELLKSEPAMRVKFFITSRPTAPAFQSIDANSGQVLVLRLENEQQMIGEDVNMLIHQRLEAVTRRGNCKPSTRDELEKILISKAGRTFLWVSLVLPLLEDRLVLGPTDIESIAAQLPPDLALIYERLLYLISLPDRELVGRLLRLIVVSARPLSGEELSILMAIAPEQRSVASLQDDRLVMDSRMILAALGPLVRVCDSKISLVHPSLQEYLINLSRIPHPLSEIFGVDVQRDTSTLVSACIHYLSLEEFGEDLFQREDSSDEDSLLPEVPKQTPGDKASTFAFDLSNDLLFQDEENRDVEFKLQMARRYKLFDYAALHWATDFLRCGGSTYQVGLEAVSVICGYDRVRLTNWLLYFWISKGLPGPCVPANPLIVACYFGHINHLLTYLDTLPRPHDGILWDCLFWSAREGHTSCVKAILRQRTIRPTPGILPLHAAAQYGHLEPILALIEDDRIDVNSQDNRGHTALSLASANGHADIISALLSHKSIDPNRPDTSNYTPVFWAAVANSERAISYFLTDPRVDLDHVDKEGRTTLSWAAEDGAVGVVKGLLRSRRVTVGHKDIKGRTPISYAAQHGHLELVHLFLKSQSRVASAQDRVGRNAHSWAASQPSSHVLHELLRYNSDGADVEDKDGWAALAWAINPPGYHDNVAELLHTGTVDINRKDKIHGRTPLSWAASYGFLSIARTLSCTRGILLDSRDTSGRTPLSHAAGNGNIDVVSLLLSCDGVDINSQDHNGRTPLSWAAREGSCEAIASLLSHSPIDCSIRDALNRLPYEVALAYRQDRAANILQAHSVEGG